jgi:glycosyltransferase involved in cell wall biosynthesis
VKTLNITIIDRMLGIYYGGGENFTINIAKSLQKRGHNIKLVAGKSSKQIAPIPKEVNTFDIQYVFFPFIYNASWILDHLQESSRIRWFLYSLISHFRYRMFELAAYNKLKNDKWSDVYFLSGALVLLGTYLDRKKPTIVRWPGPPTRMARKMLMKYSHNIAGGDVYPQIKKYCTNAKYIEIGLDPDYFKPSQNKTVKKRIDFLFVGRLVKFKKLPFLIRGFYEALQENKHIFLHIVGEGGEKKNLEKLAENLNIKRFIKFHGVLYKENLLKMYQNSDVFIITSEYESFSMATTEAMACELPVIGTDLGFLPNLIKDGERGFLVELNNINELKEKILFFSQNRNKIKEFGILSRNFVEKNFSWMKSAEEIEKILYDIVSKRKKNLL